MSNARSARAEPTPKLTSAGIGRIVTVLVSQVVVAAIFFAAAGTLDVRRGWIYYGGLFAYELVAMVVMLAFFPGAAAVVNERGRPFKKDVEAWDKAFAVAYVVLLLLEPAVAGLDAGRWRASHVPGALAVPALVVTILAYALVHWAMVVNTFAETGVRLQRERGQRVISSGPYAVIRHPFYASMLLVQVVYPLGVGSLYAYVPALATCALFVWRTAREDATLRAGLAGYSEYAARVRHRLVPGVW